MSITDELRAWAKGSTLSSWTAEHLTAIADHIDAEHEKACDDAWDNGYEADYLGIEKWLTEHPQVMEHHGWIRLPKDADGEPVHVGDVMEWVRYEDDDPTIVRKVSAVGADVFFAWSDEQGRYAQYEAHAYRHHHKPTVEDVLTELTDEVWNRCCIGMTASDSGIRELVAEYAAKLRLAEEDA